MRVRLLKSLVVVLSLAAVPASAALIPHTDLATWTAAMAGMTISLHFRFEWLLITS